MVNLREQINRADKKLLEVLTKRFAIAYKIGIYKKKHNLKPKDPEREAQALDQRAEWAKKLNLDLVFINKLFNLIFRQVCKNHRKIKLDI